MVGKKGYVYLLCDTNNEGVYKIGVTRGSLEKRIKKLQTGNSGEIYLFDKFESDYPFYVESCMHRRYMSENVMNEWFTLSLDEAKKFKETCKIYEDIADSLKDNPFFRYNKKKITDIHDEQG